MELTGVKRLRELILELAVRGSLVDQDTSDEPAQKLLEQCLKAKAVSVELGKLKKVRKHASITNDDTSFSLPQGWVWSRLDDVVRVINGRAYKKHEMLSSGTPLLRVGNLFTSNDWYYSDLELEDDKYIDSGDLIYAWSASFGPFIWDGGRAIYHYHIWKLDLFDEAAIDKRFLYLYLKAVTEEIKSSGSGIAMIHMTKSKMEELIVPVPPLKEQHRIVQKVDELMALCDRLEQQTNDQLEAHETLVDTLLGTLTQSENATELADNWTRLAAHFDTLFTTEQSIDKLKQTILQLAVMGRLVEQDAGDEPGSTFVSKMLKARDHLASNEGMRTKAGNDVSPDEKYLSLPDTWEWIKLGNIAKFIDYRGKTPIKTSHGKRLITAKNIRQGYIDLEPEEFISEEDYTEWMTRGFPRKGDLLFTPEAPLGNAAIVDLNEEFALAQRAICFQWHILDISRFMLIQIMASPFQEKLVENATGMTATGIKASKLKEIPVAIPPLKEQHRIVQKVDELMALCDQLKERLNRARGTRCQLAETIVQQALS
ncbi:MAG: type I restriction endonuclease subunit S [Marinimicrobium sp.]|nr:type I restriction endonuclease subunit S [Marinimicrobium sp.]